MGCNMQGAGCGIGFGVLKFQSFGLGVWGFGFKVRF